MRIALIQYDPKLGQVKHNIARVDQLLNGYKKGDFEILLLPEMAFTGRRHRIALHIGYVFKDKNHIEPYMEEEDGTTFTWCKTQAIRLNCYVAAGFPWKTKEGNTFLRLTEKGKYFNAMCLVSSDGQRVVTYAKHFLYPVSLSGSLLRYETDKSWADEGPSFTAVSI